MTTNNFKLPFFDPSPIRNGALRQSDVVTPGTGWQARRMRAAGMGGYLETKHTSQLSFSAGSGHE